MKKLILLIIGLLVSVSCYEMSLETQKKTKLSSASFLVAFSSIKSHEGNYANHPDDKGGETYCGITRKFNKHWKGWRYVDQAKPLNPYDSAGPMVSHYVLDYYLDMWVKEGFYLLKDQQVANYVLDFRCNGTVGIKLTQRVLREMGQEVDLDNVMDEDVARAINAVNKKEFLTRLKYKRVLFYRSIVKRDASQKKFLAHWLYRAQKV